MPILWRWTQWDMEGTLQIPTLRKWIQLGMNGILEIPTMRKWIRRRMKGKWIEISTPINKLAIASVIRDRQMEFCRGFHCRSGDSDEDLYPEMNLKKRAIWFLLCWMNSTENGEAQKTSQRISEYLREELPEGLSSRCTVNRGIETHNMRPVKWESMSTLCAAVA